MSHFENLRGHFARNARQSSKAPTGTGLGIEEGYPLSDSSVRRFLQLVGTRLHSCWFRVVLIACFESKNRPVITQTYFRRHKPLSCQDSQIKATAKCPPPRTVALNPVPAPPASLMSCLGAVIQGDFMSPNKPTAGVTRSPTALIVGRTSLERSTRVSVVIL